MYFLTGSNEVLNDDDIQARFISVADNEHALKFANSHHSINAFSRLKDCGIEPVFAYSKKSRHGIFSDLDQFKNEPWGDEGTLEREAFFSAIDTQMKAVKNVDGLLLSGGIDSLILMLLSDKKTPCFTWDVEPGQTAFAKFLCNKFGRKHYIVPPFSHFTKNKRDEVLFASMQLRSKFLGHYLPWNSGIAGQSEFHGKSLFSGQNADSLLVGDTFAPVFNSYGMRYKFELFQNRKYRRSLNESFLTSIYDFQTIDTILDYILVKTFGSLDEHVHVTVDEIFEAGRNVDAASIRHFLKVAPISNPGDYTFALKKFKFHRFVAPTIEAYKQQENFFGLRRILPFSSSTVLPHILNYVPGIRDVDLPKTLFHEFCLNQGFDYNFNKDSILRANLGWKYFLKRALRRREFVHYQMALDQIRFELNEYGVHLNDCLKFLSLSEQDLVKKHSLMRLDRLSNYIAYTGFRP